MRSKKEIDQTQILNLQEIQEKSQVEKAVQKKKFLPTLIAIMGTLFIITGFVLVLIPDNNNETNSNDDDSINEINLEVVSMTCSKEEVDPATNATMKFIQIFDHSTTNLLEKYNATITVNNASEEVLQAFNTEFNSVNQMLIEVPGYTGTIEQTTTSNEPVLNYNIYLDLDQFDNNVIGWSPSWSLVFNYKKEQSIPDIKTLLETNEYQCK